MLNVRRGSENWTICGWHRPREFLNTYSLYEFINCFGAAIRLINLQPINKEPN